MLARINGHTARDLDSTAPLELDEDPGHTGRMTQVSSIARLKVTRMVPERIRFQARGRTRKPKRNAS